MERMGDIVQQHGLNNISTSLMKNCKLLVWLLVAVESLLSADNSLAGVRIKPGGFADVEISTCLSFENCFTHESSFSPLANFGSINAETSSAFDGASAITRAALSIGILGNGVEFTESVEGSSVGSNPRFIVFASSIGNSTSLVMEIDKPKKIKLEIGEDILLKEFSAGRIQTSLVLLTKDSRGRLISLYSDNFTPACGDPINGCRNKTLFKLSLEVVPGQEIFVSPTTSGSVGFFGFESTFSGQVTYTISVIEEGCQGLRVVPFSDVLPNNSGIKGDISTTIIASVSSPAPDGGCEVTFEQPKPVAYSGGHNHDDNTRPHGSLDKTTCTIQEGTTFCTVKYTSSEVSGEEKIKAKLTSTGEQAEGIVKVKVSGLLPLETKPNLLPWGQTDKHTAGNNNHGTTHTRDAAYFAVSEYAKEYFNLNLDPDIRLAVIDMSLPWGGLFDIDGNWKPPHSLHRVGRSVDFSKHYKDGNGNDLEVTFFDEDGNVAEITQIIDDKELDDIFFKNNNNKCKRKEKKIGKIHYECTK